MSGINIGLLGPIRLELDGTETAIHRRQVRTVFTLLALHPQREVSIDVIIEALWEDDLPRDPGHAVHVYVSRLRALAPAVADAVQTTTGGYLLAIDPEETDVVRFERLSGMARIQLGDDPAGARRTLDAALGLWRGPAFGTLHYAEFLNHAVARLEELRLSALADVCEAAIRLSDASCILDKLRDLVHTHPLRDRFAQLLVIALEADGRHAEALLEHRNYCRRIEQEFGIATSMPYPTLAARAVGA